MRLLACQRRACRSSLPKSRSHCKPPLRCGTAARMPPVGFVFALRMQPAEGSCHEPWVQNMAIRGYIIQSYKPHANECPPHTCIVFQVLEHVAQHA